MNRGKFKRIFSYEVFGRCIIMAAIFCGLAFPTAVMALDLNVVGPATYRWLIEEDATYHVEPGVTDPNTLALDFHRSYMPVVAAGEETDPLPALDPTKHYFISVLPKVSGTYAMGGAPIAPGQSTVTVHLHELPLPTAQITIFVFEDTQPINSAPDLPEEAGLPGFQITVEDAGGRYGMSAGMQMLDAFGNPLGTVYQRNDDGTAVLDADGNPVVSTDKQGTPVVEPLITGPDGRLTIRNLAPGKYGIQAIPPAGSGYQQTSTIEGTKVIDAWVKANEPPFFAEFGPPGEHVFIGFVKPTVDATVLTGGATITGQVVNLHLSRPPDYAFYNGAPFAHTTPWVGLNDLSAGQGSAVYAAPTDGNGNFSIPNVPAGNYQLVVWDSALDLIFAFKGVSVGENLSCNGGGCDLGDVPVFQWFTRLENFVFYDTNGDGRRDPGEMGIPEQAVNLRWRDGTMYQSMATDGEGYVPFDQVFPFFSWLVAEVDFLRFKATGVTATIDGGGAIPFGDPLSFGGQLSPQMQADGSFQRTDTESKLTQAFQGFLGQTSVLEWGKQAYAPGENGGISGVVYYSTTRGEDDPRYGVAEPWEPGIPRVTVNLYDAAGTTLLNTTTTDSWDDSLPTECPGYDPIDPVTPLDKCYDGLRNFNQVRPGVFDGGYAFETWFVDSEGNPVSPGTEGAIEELLPAGEYIVEVIPPPGYEIVKEEDRNVDFGEDYIPSPLLLPPVCANWTDDDGDGIPGHLVPDELSLFPGVPAAFAGQNRPLCDRKQVLLSSGQNAAADFFFFTHVPIAGHIKGFILDDTANEGDPTSPQFGEKYAPPWLPVSIRDWTGREINRTYSDEWGTYNALVPSTYTANLPQPSGMSPHMITTCMNDPRFPNGELDPNFNPQYSTFCYTFQYMPGTTTYLDTPVVPVAAFAGPDQSPLDCEFPAGTPRIKQVVGGPHVAAPGVSITIEAIGEVLVPNPAFDGINSKTIYRDFGFGEDQGLVTINGVPLNISSWGPTSISGTVAPGTTTGQLVVTRGDNGKSSITGVTMTVGGSATTVSGSIQAAIDSARAGDLLLVPPGHYNEMVIMWKPVRLQGYGEGSTVISALKTPADDLTLWRAKVQALVEGNEVDLLPSQGADFGGIEPGTLFTEEGAGIIVLASRNGRDVFRRYPSRIDGFTITSADTGGGIMVNGYADFLEISNNRIINNTGFFGGGIRVGHPELVFEQGGSVLYEDAENNGIRIHDNQISQNGSLGGAGGGVSICTGSDGYEIYGNFICGNFTLGQGGGIGHLGLSPGGRIEDNKILFNESFNQGLTVSGGGIFIGGGAPLNGPGSLSPGSGTVLINRNLLQGNLAGAGDGGGIRTALVNGQDVTDNSIKTDDWYRIDIFNNMIVNNVAALAGGGISLQDTLRANIAHNTIVNNDSTATAGEAFSPGEPNTSNPQPAGVVSRVHSTALAAALPPGEAAFSNPRMVNDIIWHNRSFYYTGDPNADPPVYQLMPDVGAGDAPVFSDLGVLPAGSGVLTTESSILSGGALVPSFLAEYFNGNRDLTIALPETTTSIQAPAAFDEGGNFIRLRYGPLTQTRPDTGALYGNYHLAPGSAGIDAGIDLNSTIGVDLLWDYDDDMRPNGLVDIGADEVY